jgi:threonine/homoserine/homoserine lactone efflux protein
VPLDLLPPQGLPGLSQPLPAARVKARPRRRQLGCGGLREAATIASTMPSLPTLAVYALTAVVVLLVPGPAVLYIVSQSVRQGRHAGIASVLGIHTGTLVQVVAAVLGASWLLLSSAVAFSAVKYVGAAYLIYLGVRKLLGRDEGQAIQARAEPRRLARTYYQGVLVNVLNPKLALFFFAFLPQFVDPARGAVAAQVATFGVVFVLLGLCTDGAYALVAGTVGPWLRRNARLLRGERYVVGTTFVGLGVAAAVSGARRTR